MNQRLLSFLLGIPLVGSYLAADQGPPAAEEGYPTLELSAEVKLNFRSSRDLQVVPRSLRAPEMAPPPAGWLLRTPAPQESFEVSNLALILDARFSPEIHGRLKVHLFDLYDRNPTSSDERLHLREAWVVFGQKEERESPQGSGFFLLLGKAPRFTKQLDRRLESYGLWGTAVGRFEQVQLQVGGNLGPHVFFRLHVANPNPLFLRDTNVLAGDNGTAEQWRDPDGPVYFSGFPILYDAKGNDVNFSGHWETGLGLGVRWWHPETGEGAEGLFWGFRRTMAQGERIRGTLYRGELELLRGLGNPMPFSGRNKTELGFNGRVRWRGLRVFAQAVKQEIADLQRHGLEVEVAWRFPLPGFVLSGDRPVVDWVQPAVRFSEIENEFLVPSGFFAPSLAWDWQKWDVGIRVGILAGLDITLEYARHDMELRNGRSLHPDEFLTTLRVRF